MNKSIPKIRIQTSYLLEDRFDIPKMDTAQTNKLEKHWGEHERAILNHLQDITGLTFAQNIIDVYVVDPDALGGMSDPLIIGGATGKNRFIFMLAHELTHRLIFDNEKGIDWHKLAWKLWPKEKHLVAHHVVVHAILELLFSNSEYDDGALAIDKEIAQKSPEYTRAWEIVAEEGAQSILEKIRKA